MVAVDVEQRLSPAELRGSRDKAAHAGSEPARRFKLDGATPSPVGIRFDPVLPFEQWQQIGLRLALHASASTWWLGDWLAYGQYKYGRRYRNAISATGLDYQTLRNYASVARRFELSRRRDKLSFQHHAEVCALPRSEQDAWLDRAEQNHWARNELRRQLRLARRQLVGPEDPSEPDSFVPLAIFASSDQITRWRQLAHQAHQTLNAWIVASLEQSVAL